MADPSPTPDDPDIAAYRALLRGQGQGTAPGVTQGEDPDVTAYRKFINPSGQPATTGASESPVQMRGMSSAWGPVNEALNRGMFGWGVPLIAGVEAATRGVQDVARGIPLSTAYGNAVGTYYPQSNQYYQGAENLYQHQQPIQSALAGGVGGGALAAVPIVGAEGALSRGAGAVADLLPQSWRPTLNWLAGYGGENAASRLGSKALLGVRQGVVAEAAQNEPEKDKNYLLAAGLGAGTQALTHELLSAPYTQGMDTQIDPTVKANALGLQRQGIDVHGGDLAGNLPKVPGTPEQLAQTTRAINRTAGLDSDRLTPQIINDHLQNTLGPRLDDIANRAGGVAMFGGPGAPSLANDLSGIRNQMAQDPNLVDLNIKAGTPQALDGKYPRLMSVMSKIENSMDPSTGQIPGDQYVNLTRSGKARGEVNIAANDPDPNIAKYGQAMKDALSDALDRSAPPGLRDELAQARFQYKNAKILQRIAPQAERDSAGFIDPTKLQGPIASSFKGRDAGDLGDISAGARLLPRANPQGDVIPPKQGGGIMRNLLGPFSHGLGGAALGGALLEHYGVPVLEHMATDFPVASALGVGAGLARMAGSWAGRRLINSPSYTNLLLGNDTPGAATLGNLIRYGEQAPTQMTNALMHSQPPKDEAQEP